MRTRIVLLALSSVFTSFTAFSQNHPVNARLEWKVMWVCKVYDSGRVQCRPFKSFIATARRSGIAEQLIVRTRQLVQEANNREQTVNPRNVGKNLSVVQCSSFAGPAQVVGLGSGVLKQIKGQALNFCGVSLDNLSNQLKQSRPSFVGPESLQSATQSSSGACGNQAQGGIAVGWEEVAIDAGKDLLEKGVEYVVEQLFDDSRESATAGSRETPRAGHEEEHQAISYAENGKVTDVKTDWSKDTSVTENPNGSKTVTTVERTTTTTTVTDNSGNTTKTTNVTETKTVSNPDGSKTVTTTTVTNETKSQTTETSQTETTEFNPDGSEKSKTKSPKTTETKKTQSTPGQCGLDFACSASCSERQAAWKAVIASCDKRGWSTYECKSLLAAANSCADPATVMPLPDGDYHCGRTISAEELARIRKDACSKQQGIMSKERDGSVACTIKYNQSYKQLPAWRGFNPCGDPRAMPTPEGCNLKLVIPQIKPVAPVPGKPPVPPPH